MPRKNALTVRASRNTTSMPPASRIQFRSYLSMCISSTPDQHFDIPVDPQAGENRRVSQQNRPRPPRSVDLLRLRGPLDRVSFVRLHLGCHETPSFHLRSNDAFATTRLHRG